MDKNKFKRPYEIHERSISPSGEKEENTYGYEINKAGQKILAVNGKVNVYDKIQEYVEETKIENILARAATGDTSVFRPEGIYGDMTTAPANLIEAREMMQKLENTWNSLPNEIKNKYNNDVETFIGQAGNISWLEDMGLITKDTPKEIKQEIKETVNEATTKGVENE